MNEKQQKTIKGNFKSGLAGIIHNSGGLTELLCTKFNLCSAFIALSIIILFFLNIKTAEDSLQLIDSLNTTAISILGGIVGLSLAGLTLIITFGNPEVIERSSKKQSEQFIYKDSFDVSYFQKAIAKFAFIVFFQVLILIVFFVCSTIRGLNLKAHEDLAYWINSIVFALNVYLVTFSLILVIASIMNLFTFSQTSNFFNFMKHVNDTSDRVNDQTR